MELIVKPHRANTYPVGAILIQGASVRGWLQEMQQIGVELDRSVVYPIPGNTPNTVWGCLVECAVDTLHKDIRSNSYCQIVDNLLFIPEHAALYPALTEGELGQLFASKKHLLHPAVGLVELADSIHWEDVLRIQAPLIVNQRKPEPTVSLPQRIRSMQIRPPAPEDILKSMEDFALPDKERREDTPLSILEKIWLLVLSFLFNVVLPSPVAKPPQHSGANQPTGGWNQRIKAMRAYFVRETGRRQQELYTDYKELEQRNRKQLDKLLEMIKNNPDKALKYAMPLDMDGTARGKGNAALGLWERWLSFSIFDNQSGGRGAGTVLLPQESFYRLQEQYTGMAQDFVQRKEYQKAAFVYIKLLKNYTLAAQTLENGGLYQEAAAVYLQYMRNKEQAARCYEKGAMTTEAIALYKELDQHEKVGDLYSALYSMDKANIYFEKAVEQYIGRQQLVKAALIYKDKMHDIPKARALFLEGWRTDKEAFDCLSHYLTTFDTVQLAGAALETVYARELHNNNKRVFLQVLQREYRKKNELSPRIRNMAYEIIAELTPHNPAIVSELQSFNNNDQLIGKDILRFKTKR